VRFGGRAIPIVLPKLSDPRLKLSATIVTLTVLGQTILNFQVSLPQIMVCVLLCAVIDIAMTYRRDKVLVWPASGIQTGISVAFIFRVGGTRHGDLWSIRGLHLFVLVVLLSMVPKYVLRLNGRHIFNPSNIGLAWGLLPIVQASAGLAVGEIGLLAAACGGGGKGTAASPEPSSASVDPTTGATFIPGTSVEAATARTADASSCRPR